MTRIGLMHSLIRPEEKLLIREFQTREGVELKLIDDRKLSYNLGKDKFDLDLVLERCINHSRALHALRLFESAGLKCVNSSKVATICGDKILTSIHLQEHNIPQPEVRIAFTEESTLQAIEEMGYPVVLKPAVGSWGRLLSKVNDRDAAESTVPPQTGHSGILSPPSETSCSRTVGRHRSKGPSCSCCCCLVVSLVQRQQAKHSQHLFSSWVRVKLCNV